MFRPIATLGSLRACGAQIFFSNALNVFANMKSVAVLGAIDSHGGTAITTTFQVYANMQPVVRLGDISSVCPWVYPQHYAQPIILAEATILSG